MANIHIGTSGWNYKHWKEKFYPSELSQRKWLDYYAQNFPTVEINYSFYRLPTVKSISSWYDTVPNDFLFAVKASRLITHLKKLKEIEEPLKTFLENFSNLKDKLSIILFQLPPNFKADLSKLENLLKIIPLKLKTAFEFRHQSWFCILTYKLLEKYQSSLVIADSSRFPTEKLITAPFSYIRFHGGQKLYGSNYSDQELKNYAAFIEKESYNGIDFFIYFNNDAYGYALENAKTLAKMLDISLVKN